MNKWISLLFAAALTLTNADRARAAAIHTREATMPMRAHGGFLTGHFEFDMAIILFVLAVMTASFLIIPEDAPKGVGRRAMQGLVITLTLGGIVFAVVGFRRLVAGTL